MISENWKALIENIKSDGVITTIIDIALIIVLFIFIYKIFKMKIKILNLVLITLIGVVVYFLAYLFSFDMFLTVYRVVIFWSIGLLIIVYNQEIKHMLDALFTSNKLDNTLSTKQEKKEIIDILCSTTEYLSKRKIGALITIECEDSLSSFIDKAINIRSVITQEILTTIFTPGTACHDGAVIIRKNRIMCAGAYYPSTDKYDVPKFLGTRHRAAIGLSERYDAVTIVVSEETGNISVTIDGVINLELTIERLEEMLDRYILNK